MKIINIRKKMRILSMSVIIILMLSTSVLYVDNINHEKDKQKLRIEGEELKNNNKKLKNNVSKLNSNIEELNINVNTLSQDNAKLKYESEELKARVEELVKERDRLKITSRGNRSAAISNNTATGKELGIFTISAYDLSVQSCGKAVGSKGYGITATGFDLSGKTREQARTIATDPKIIPLGSKVKIEFLDNSKSYLNGIYISRDTGSAIKQKKIDIFFGDFKNNKTHQSVWDFGVNKAKITLID